MTINFNDDQTISINAYYSSVKNLAPKITYSILLSKNYEILKSSPEEISLSNYNMEKLVSILTSSLFFGGIFSLPIIFIICIIWDLVSFFRKRAIKN